MPVIHPFISLTHCGIETPYGDIGLTQHWFRWWLAACRHQAINLTNVDLSSARSSENHQTTISQEIAPPSITEFSLKINFLKFSSNLPRANELNRDTWSWYAHTSSCHHGACRYPGNKRAPGHQLPLWVECDYNITWAILMGYCKKDATPLLTHWS